LQKENHKGLKKGFKKRRRRRSIGIVEEKKN
jgi:hypothetical protein